MKNVAALILAAGGSSRFGQPKQLVQLKGKSLLQWVVDAAIGANCCPIAVVLGSSMEQVSAELNGPITFVQNRIWQRGIGTSIRAGVQHLIESGDDIAAIILLACDQPFVDAEVIEQIIALRQKTEKPIVASTLGVPALFDRSCFNELLELSDDHGAKTILLSDRDRVAEFSFAKGEIDIDTAEDWEAAGSGRARPLGAPPP